MTQVGQCDRRDHWQALERAVNETEVLRAIYGGIHPDQAALDMSSSITMSSLSCFQILSPSGEEMKRIKKTFGLIEEDDESISTAENENDGGDDHEIPKKSSLEPPAIQIEILIRIESETKTMATTTASVATGEVDGESNHSSIEIILRCLLPRGYPEFSPAVVTSNQIKSTPSLNRSSIDEITRALNEKARNLLGTESIMDLVEETKELALAKHQQKVQEEKKEPKELKEDQKQQRSNESSNLKESSESPASSFGRRWIWVHHITSKDRIKSIRAEAERLNLKGILKHGYPGVVLVEGRLKACNTFVKWIKGDKSSPLGGGFGRNWGHHVRGEIDFNIDGYDDEHIDPSLATTNTQCARLKILEATEDLSVMANHCKNAGLEDEFREFVLKHR